MALRYRQRVALRERNCEAQRNSPCDAGSKRPTRKADRMISLDQEAGVRVGSDDGRMRPLRTNSEGPIDAFDHGKVVAASTLWELADKLSRVLGQRRDTFPVRHTASATSRAE